MAATLPGRMWRGVAAERSAHILIVTTPDFDQPFWEQLWSRTLREEANNVARRPPNAHLMAEAGRLRPGRALDGGVATVQTPSGSPRGAGGSRLWTSPRRRWRTGGATAGIAGADVAERLAWFQADLATWSAEPGRYDLVVCLYVHVASSVEEMVRRMAAGVAPGGSLLLVGHRPMDPSTGAATAAANREQVSVEGAVAALDPGMWELLVGEERPRAVAGAGVDAVIHARRRT